MQSTSLAIDVVLNELQPRSVTGKGSTLRVCMRMQTGKIKDERRTVVIRTRKPGIFIHGYLVVRTRPVCGEKIVFTLKERTVG